MDEYGEPNMQKSQVISFLIICLFVIIHNSYLFQKDMESNYPRIKHPINTSSLYVSDEPDMTLLANMGIHFIQWRYSAKAPWSLEVKLDRDGICWAGGQTDAIEETLSVSVGSLEPGDYEYVIVVTGSQGQVSDRVLVTVIFRIDIPILAIVAIGSVITIIVVLKPFLRRSMRDNP